MSKKTFRFLSDEWRNYLVFCEFYNLKPSNAKHIKIFVKLNKPTIIHN